LVNTQQLRNFKTDFTISLSTFNDIPSISKKIIEHYSKCYSKHNFAVRVLLPREKNSDNVNLKSKKLGHQLQSELLFGIRKAKQRPNLKEFRYIHDEEHFGWILFDPSLSDLLE
jgi:hypothetical protein